MKKIAMLALACLGLISTPVLAETEIRQETVHFEKGKDGAVLKGRLKGYETVDYRFDPRRTGHHSRLSA